VSDPVFTATRGLSLALGAGPDVLKSLLANRDQLIRAALQAPFDPLGSVPNLLSPALDGLGERIVRLTCLLADDDQLHAGVKGVVGSTGVPSLPQEAQQILEPLQNLILDPLLKSFGIPDARMRGALIAAQLSGLVATRYIARMEPLASVSDDVIAAWYGPIIQHLIDPSKPLPSGSDQ